MSSVAQILDNVATNNQKPAQDRPKFEATWAPFKTLVLREQGSENILLRVQVNCSNHHQRRFSWQFVDEQGRGMRFQARFDAAGPDVKLNSDVFEGAIHLIKETQDLIQAEMKADAEKIAKHFNRKASAQNDTGKPRPTQAIRAEGKTQKKRDKEAARKAEAKS